MALPAVGSLSQTQITTIPRAVGSPETWLGGDDYRITPGFTPLRKPGPDLYLQKLISRKYVLCSGAYHVGTGLGSALEMAGWGSCKTDIEDKEQTGTPDLISWQLPRHDFLAQKTPTKQA